MLSAKGIFLLRTALKPLNWIWRKLIESKISMSSTKFVFFGPIKKPRCGNKCGTLYSGARYVALWASCSAKSWSTEVWCRVNYLHRRLKIFKSMVFLVMEFDLGLENYGKLDMLVLDPCSALEVTVELAATIHLFCQDLLISLTAGCCSLYFHTFLVTTSF